MHVCENLVFKCFLSFRMCIVCFCLCVRQVDVIGQKVQDIVHPQDCSEVLRIFQTQGHDSEQGQRSMPVLGHEKELK